MSEFPHPFPWKKYGAIAALLVIVNLVAYLVFGGRNTDAWLSVLTFTLIYAVIWFAIKVFDSEKAYRLRHAREPMHYYLTTLMEVVLLVVAIYVYFYFALGHREPMHALVGFLREKFAASYKMTLLLVGIFVFFLVYLTIEFFRPNGEEDPR